jgi:hypothetical protein
METGQLSSAILEFETVLQRCPDDAEVQAALREIESKAGKDHMHLEGMEPAALSMVPDTNPAAKKSQAVTTEVEDGRKMFYKVFVESKLITARDFDLCWRPTDLTKMPDEPVEPFIQTLQDKGVMPVEKSLKILSDKSRMAYLPLDKYDSDIDLTRGFSAEICRRWCVQPFDRMSKAILVATANPFNQQAVKELTATTSHRLVWYLVPPIDLMQNLRKAFR